MNSDAAKEILSAYRSGDRDGVDPIFHEALQQMENDSELKKWFEEQHDLDGAIRQKLASIEPPPDLQAKILAQIRGQKVRSWRTIASSRSGSRSNTTWTGRSGRSWPVSSHRLISKQRFWPRLEDKKSDLGER